MKVSFKILARNRQLKDKTFPVNIRTGWKSN